MQRNAIRLRQMRRALLILFIGGLLVGTARPAAGQADDAAEEAQAVQDDGAPDEPSDGPTAQQEYEAEQSAAAQEGIAGFFQRSADNITSQLQSEFLRFGGFIQQDPISQLGREFRAFNEDLRFTTRLDLGLAYTALVQYASKGAERWAAAGDFDVFGTWHAIGEEGRDAGLLGFEVEYRHNFGGITPSELNQQFGSLLLTSSGFNDHAVGLKQIWWQQVFLDGQIFLRGGKIDQSNFFSTNRYQSANFFFLNQGLASSLAVPFPETGLGIVAFGFPDEWFYVGAGIGDASPSDTSFSANNLDEELFIALEAGFLTALEGYGAGTYRFTVSHTDAVPSRNQPSGAAFAISIDQELGKFVPFARLAISSEKGLTTFRKIFSAGFGLVDPFGNQGDEFGVGLVLTEPDNQELRNEWVLESFYRIQLTPTLQITPDLQLIINPASGTSDLVAVASLRFRIQY